MPLRPGTGGAAAGTALAGMDAGGGSDREPKKKFKSYPIGYFHVDIAEAQRAEGKLYLFVAIDRTSKFAFAELYTKGGKMNAAQFLRNPIAAVPDTIHTVLTDNGIQFTNRAVIEMPSSTSSTGSAAITASSIA